MVRVPRVEHGGQSRNPANCLSAATLAMGNTLVTQMSESMKDAKSPQICKRAKLGTSVIRKFMSYPFGSSALDSTLTIPNPDNLSYYDAIKYAIDALSENLGIRVFNAIESKIDTHKSFLKRRLAGEHKVNLEGSWDCDDWIDLNYVQRAGLLLYLIQEGRHTISNQEECLIRFRVSILSVLDNELHKRYYKMLRSITSLKTSTLAARKTESVPQLEHGGQSRNPANWLGAAKIPPSDRLADTSSVILKLLPDEIGIDLNIKAPIPNPDGLSYYDAIKYAINALPEDQEKAHVIDALKSEIHKHKRFLSGRLAGEWRLAHEGCRPLLVFQYLNFMQRAGVLLYIIKEGLHYFSSEDESLKRFKRGIISEIKSVVDFVYSDISGLEPATLLTSSE